MLEMVSLKSGNTCVCVHFYVMVIYIFNRESILTRKQSNTNKLHVL